MALDLMADIPQRVQISEMGAAFLQPGVYFLWHADSVVYVGQSKTVLARILQHIADGKKVFDGVSLLPCRAKNLLAEERRYIERLLPKYNNCGLAKSARRIWSGHMQDRPVADCRLGPVSAAKMLGVTSDELKALHQHGLPYRRFRVPRANVMRTTYSLADLHQFSAQRQDAFRAVRTASPAL